MIFQGGGGLDPPMFHQYKLFSKTIKKNPNFEILCIVKWSISVNSDQKQSPGRYLLFVHVFGSSSLLNKSNIGFNP